MFLIVGLGNIGKKYIDTRHNIGFKVVDKIAEILKVSFIPGKGEYYFSRTKYDDQDIILLKPTTYMNNSGIAVSDVVEAYGISLSDLLIICDDFNLPVGKIRLRPRGSDGGHNGLESVIYHLFSEEFPRLRVGVGDNFIKGKVEEFVLSKFLESEKEIIYTAIDNASQAVLYFLTHGIQKTMNKFN